MIAVIICSPIAADVISPIYNNIKLPDESVTWYNDGVALDKLGRYNDSLVAYDQAIKINPNFTLAWLNRGSALYNLGRYDDSLASCDQAIKIDPNFTSAWYNRGFMLDKIGRYNDSLASYDIVIKKSAYIGPPRYVESLTPGDHIVFTDLYNNRGVVLTKLGRYDEAIASYNKSLEIDPNNLNATKNREIALKRQKAPLIYAPIGAITLMVALSGWRKRR